MVSVRRVHGFDETLHAGLSALLIDAVHDGASVGFLAPLTEDRARRYWSGVADALARDTLLWVATAADSIAGSVQLCRCLKENGRHRGEVQKLFVLTSQRGNGVASQLMTELERCAIEEQLSLLVLDTIAGSPAESVYAHLGWHKAGEIPVYAAMPDGELRATAYYYKRLAR
jgi:acetyltransferase